MKMATRLNGKDRKEVELGLYIRYKGMVIWRWEASLFRYEIKASVIAISPKRMRCISDFHSSSKSERLFYGMDRQRSDANI